MVLSLARRTVAILVVFLIFGAPSLLMAQNQGPLPQIVPNECNRPGGCQSVCDIIKLAENLLQVAIFMAVVLSALAFAYAGWNMLTSGGNSEQYSKGKKVFVNVFIGICLVLAGWIIVETLMNTLAGGQGVTWRVSCQSRP